MLRSFLRLTYDLAGTLAAAFVAAIFVVMIVASALRQLGIAAAGTDDLVSWMTAAAAFLGMAHTFRNGDFVRMTLVLDALDAKARHAAEILALIVGVVATGFGSWWVIVSVYESWKFEDMSQGLLVVALWIPQLSFALGAVLLFVAMIEELIRVVQGLKPTYVEAVEERHARGDYSEEI
jgi:TRAP-type C4-dicarboxylate transport system permease small subunit